MHSNSTSSISSTINTIPIATSNSCITNFGRSENIHRKLLYDLMSTIYEYIVISTPNVIATDIATNTDAAKIAQESNVTELRSSLNNEVLLLRIHTCLEQIFLNGLRLFKPDKTPDFWRFIEALNWINPLMMVSVANKTSYNKNFSVPIQLPKNLRIRNDKALAWIYENLMSQQLEIKIRHLLSDSEHLTNCYDVTAFFHSQKFVAALFMCLSAFTKGQYEILAQIDKNLYATAVTESLLHFGETSRKKEILSSEAKNTSSSVETKNIIMEDISNSISLRSHRTDVNPSPSQQLMNENLYDSSDKSIVNNENKFKVMKSKMSSKWLRPHSGRNRCKFKHWVRIKIRPWVSLPDIRHFPRSEHRPRSKSQSCQMKSTRIKLTTENLAIKEKQKVPSIQINHRKVATSASSLPLAEPSNAADTLQPINLVKCDDIKIHLDRRQLSCIRSTEFSSSPVNFTSSSNEYPLTNKSSGNLTGILTCLPQKMLPFLSSTNSSGTSNESNSGLNKPTPNSAPADFASLFPANGEKIENRYSNIRLFDDVGSNSSSVSPHCTQASRAQPTRGQSLTSYLQEAQKNQMNLSDLERENAHFNLSDAIIAAIEEIKCSRHERRKEKQNKSVARKKRKFHRKPRLLKNWVSDQQENEMDFSDHETSTSASATTLSRTSSSDSDLSHVSSTSSTSTASKAGDLKCLKKFSVSSHSINDHTAYAEWAENSIETLSAEGIALSLISKFKDRQLPRAADLLLKATDHFHAMNRIFDIAPEEIYQMPYTRGTSDWAPPRAQIIFTRHPPPDRKSLLQIQKNRCAGCGMYVTAALAHSFRYCEYLGKYHCTGCHRNQISAIPARVLDRWDFSCHPVSVFSYRLLDQIWKVPLFCVPDLSKELYSKVRALRLVRLRRLQLKYIHAFIHLCRFADDDDLKREFDCIPSYIYDDIDYWSMSDFIDVRNGNFLKIINEIISKGEQHVYNCELCTAHGFICEYCTNKQVVFPWQSNVTRCAKCYSCSHSSCSKDQCHKCQRLEKRRKS